MSLNASVFRTFDHNLIKDIFKDGLYEEFKDDTDPDYPEWVPPIGHWYYWLVLLNNNEPIGVIRFDQINPICFVGHVAVIKKHRGNAVECGIKAMQYMRDNSPVRKFLGFTPYKACVNYVKKIGFKEVTTIKKATRVKGELLDLHLMEAE